MSDYSSDGYEIAKTTSSLKSDTGKELMAVAAMDIPTPVQVQAGREWVDTNAAYLIETMIREGSAIIWRHRPKTINLIVHNSNLSYKPADTIRIPQPLFKVNDGQVCYALLPEGKYSEYETNAGTRYMSPIIEKIEYDSTNGLHVMHLSMFRLFNTPQQAGEYFQRMRDLLMTGIHR